MTRSTSSRILMIGIAAAACLLALAFDCAPVVSAAPAPETPAPIGDEIIVCGQRFHTGGAPVVLWTDPNGYDFHYSSQQPDSPAGRKPSHIRMAPLTDAEVERVRRDGWTPEFLREKVDQFVIHYDVDGTSRQCFKTLEKRHLAVQFMLDLDGTIYQTMDLQEEAPHATKANGRSVGVEIANVGAYPGSLIPLLAWYKKDSGGNVAIQIPAQFGDGGIRTAHFIGRPARNEIISGNIQGKICRQYDFTPQQYNSLIRLTATLCTVFPKITCDCPRQKPQFGPPTTQMVSGPEGGPATRPDALASLYQPGPLIPHALPEEQYEVYQGVLGHYHVQTDKQDPGPAFQWDRVILGARRLMTPQALAANAAARGKPARFIESPPSPDAKKPNAARTTPPASSDPNHR